MFILVNNLQFLKYSSPISLEFIVNFENYSKH